MPMHRLTLLGETLCDDKVPIVLEKMDFPDPVIKIAIEPKSKADLEKMGMGLNKLAQEDPSFNFSRDEETNQVHIRYDPLRGWVAFLSLGPNDCLPRCSEHLGWLLSM